MLDRDTVIEAAQPSDSWLKRNLGDPLCDFAHISGPAAKLHESTVRWFLAVSIVSMTEGVVLNLFQSVHTLSQAQPPNAILVAIRHGLLLAADVCSIFCAMTLLQTIREAPAPTDHDHESPMEMCEAICGRGQADVNVNTNAQLQCQGNLPSILSTSEFDIGIAIDRDRPNSVVGI